MKDYYVVWSVYDEDQEIGHPIYRAVLRGSSKDQVEARAKSLTPQVLKYYQDQKLAFQVDNINEIEVTSRLLTEWVARLRQAGNELSLVEMDEA